MATVAILYGIVGGVHTGRTLQRQLTAAGYQVVANPADADIIFAHSAGCFWLPPPSAQKQLVLVDPPYWPGRSIRSRTSHRARSNMRYKHYGFRTQDWLARQLWGVYYACFEARRTYNILKFAPKFDLETAIADQKVLLIRNTDDSWLTPELEALRANHPNLKIVELPGDHDDCMYNPQPYVDLLQSSEL